ncbi:MAG: DUF262 domain-containing protein [Alphaproteobacteria bacterium]|nr:DUF262 domain-containing protein [Alphaproteobacteria bacterium]
MPNGQPPFTTNPILLKNLLAQVGQGALQLPDFQRGWVWDDDRIKGLIASISKGFPIGAVMTLAANGHVAFRPRPIEGAEDVAARRAPADYLLDGQQRLTSLYQALEHPGAVATQTAQGRPVKRRYYIDMRAALDTDVDREDAIISVSADGRQYGAFGREIVTDFSTPDLEHEQHAMPTERLCDEGMWIIEYIRHWEGREDHPDGSAANLVMRFKAEIMNQFALYQLPVIGLAAETPPEAVCTVFEKVNMGGVTLTTFELVTAMFAGHGFKLREDWDERRRRLHDQYDVLRGIGGEQFLQTVTLLATQTAKRQAQSAGVPVERVPGIKCKKHDVLRLQVDEYEEWADLVQIGYEEAAKFLHRQFVFTHNNVPYGTQLVPLAALFVELSSGELHSANARERLEQWYWCGVLGERYSTGTETQYALDLEEVATFVRTGEPPRIVREASFNPERLLSMTTRNSAAYKGVFALQMKRGGRDWMTGAALTQMTLENENVDIHHIFPIHYCEHRDDPIPYWLYQSVVNKAPIDAKTNRSIGGRAPSSYLPNLRERVGERLEPILESYGIDIRTLEGDQFAQFFVARARQMLEWIAGAMGKRTGTDVEALEHAVREVRDPPEPIADSA